jgi:hypothetical protein
MIAKWDLMEGKRVGLLQEIKSSDPTFEIKIGPSGAKNNALLDPMPTVR